MRWTRDVLMTLAIMGAAMVPMRAQEAAETQPARAWTNATELSLVVASGNAQAESIGFRNVYEYRWSDATLTWEKGWVRAASLDGDRVAVAEPGGGFAVVDPQPEIDSQRLYSKLGFRHEISGPHFWFANYDSVRDEPLNITRQLVGAGGFGTEWADRDALRFRTEYGVSVTSEALELEGADAFGGYRLAYALNAGVTRTLTVDSELTFDGSFDQRDDIRSDWLNGVTVSLSARIALRSSIRLLFRNRPALEAINLVTPSRDAVIGTVEIPKGKLDTSFTTSLVINF